MTKTTLAATFGAHQPHPHDVLDSLPDQRVGAFTIVPGLLASMGADPDRVLVLAGLAPDALDHPDKRIPYSILGRLLHVAAEETRCPHFGLLCGEAWQLRDFGLVGEIA